MLWVLKRTVSMRHYFWTPKTYAKNMGKKIFTIYIENFCSRHKKLSNYSGTTHYDTLQGSYGADQKDSHNEVIMTSLQGQ